MLTQWHRISVSTLPRLTERMGFSFTGRGVGLFRKVDRLSNFFQFPTCRYLTFGGGITNNAPQIMHSDYILKKYQIRIILYIVD